MKPWLPALLLALAPVVAGCGDDATPGSSAVASLPTATTLNTPLPSGWPAGLQLPAGSTVYDSAIRDGRSSVSFETQELAASVQKFLTTELTTDGWTRGARTAQDDGTVTTTWTDAPRTLTLQLQDTGNLTDVTVAIESTASASASASPSASASNSPSGSPSGSPSASSSAG